MTTQLRLTDAGRAAMLDAANVGTNSVRLTRLALGAGSGTGGSADDGRTTLRDQRDIAAAVGSAAVAGQIAVRAEFNTATAYAATELGLMARIGAGGSEFLFAYWTDGGTVFANKPANLRFIVAAVVAIVRSTATLNVTVAPNLTVGTAASGVTGVADAKTADYNVVSGDDGKTLTIDASGGARAVNLPDLGASDDGFTVTVMKTDSSANAVTVDGHSGDTLNGAATLALEEQYASVILKWDGTAWLAIGGASPGWVAARIAADRGGGVRGPADATSATYTVVSADDGKTIEVDATGGARQINLPNLGGSDDGFTVTVLKGDNSANAVTIDGDGADTINGASSYSLASQYESVILKWTGAKWLAIGGGAPAWVRKVVSDLVDSAPGTLDTLNELAAALGDDPNFSATIMGMIANRLTQAQADALYAQGFGAAKSAYLNNNAIVTSSGISGVVATNNGQYSRNLVVNFNGNMADANYLVVFQDDAGLAINQGYVIVTARAVGSVSLLARRTSQSRASFKGSLLIFGNTA